MRFRAFGAIDHLSHFGPRSPRARYAVPLLGALALVAGCWIPSTSVDYWVDNQDDAAYSVVLEHEEGPWVTMLVPPTTHGFLLSGNFAPLTGIAVLDASGALVYATEISHPYVGVIIDPAGDVTIEEGRLIPFPDAVDLDRLPPADE